MVRTAVRRPPGSGRDLTRDCLERARALAPLLGEAAPRIEASRELVPEVLEALHEAELFRLALPGELGGAELPPPRLAEITEALAMADASTAWCIGQASGCAMAAAFLSPDAAQQVFGPADAVLAWGAGAAGSATVAEGGYRVTGRWAFASGGKHATWLGAHCKVFEADGSPRLDAAGKQVNRTALLPRERAEITDDWHVVGLRGTRSDGYAIDDLLVPESLTLDRESPSECRHDAPLYRFSTTLVYAACFSGVALGIARAMLDDLVALATHKTPRGASPMRDNQYVQTRIAELEAQLSSARAFQREALAGAWDAVIDTGALDLDSRVRVRLATTHAIVQATDVTDQAYRLAGATAIFDSRSFERRLRDAHAVSQQIQGRFTSFETVGRHLLGHEVDSPFL